ncbi:type II and III secretion system protein family protein [Lacibacterium aquatile]|uniref:Type II and III secretion system protein family protein n=1 Tax=Lacibacterium aquatile TaxID=1168082 RepID=A0ABW5DTG6_9PROT
MINLRQGLLALIFLVSPVLANAQVLEYVIPLGKGRSVELKRDARDVFVASPDIADVTANTPRLFYIVANKIGTTNAFFSDAAGKPILEVSIRVEADVPGIQNALRQALPDAQFQVYAAGDKVFLAGTVVSASAADQAERIARLYVKDDKGLVNLLKVTGGDQILLRVRVAEMRRSVARQLGINALKADGSSIGLSAGRATTGAFGQVNFSINTNAFDTLSASIDALEDQGLVKTLAEPNVTAISGESAGFLAGGEFPVPISRDQQGNSVVEFKPFGVGLNFTPVVLSSGRISLKMSTEVSSLTDEGSQVVGQLRIPGLSVRRVETTVEMPSGSSLVVAGLLRNDLNTSSSGLPGLMEIPILGSLFRSTSFQRNESELVVLVTPYVVRPTQDGLLTLPTAGQQPPDDIDLFLFKRLGFTNPNEARASVKGPVGYVFD